MFVCETVHVSIARCRRDFLPCLTRRPSIISQAENRKVFRIMRAIGSTGTINALLFICCFFLYLFLSFSFYGSVHFVLSLSPVEFSICFLSLSLSFSSFLHFHSPFVFVVFSLFRMCSLFLPFFLFWEVPLSFLAIFLSCFRPSLPPSFLSFFPFFLSFFLPFFLSFFISFVLSLMLSLCCSFFLSFIFSCFFKVILLSFMISCLFPAFLHLFCFSYIFVNCHLHSFISVSSFFACLLVLFFL